MKALRLKTISLPWQNKVCGVTEVPQLPGIEKHVLRLRWLRWALLTIFILNVLDGWFTILWIQQGLATEANPVMAYLLHIHPGVFMLGKLGMVFGGSLILLRFYNKPTAVLGVMILLSVYTLLLMYHGKGFALLLA